MRLLLQVALILGLLYASCFAGRTVVEESPDHVPSSWSLSGVPDPDHALELSVALKIQNVEQLEALGFN